MNPNASTFLLKNCDIYAPKHIANKDILICGGKIVHVNKTIEPPPSMDVKEENVAGKKVLPGFIDLHVHTIGGGGEGGPRFRVPGLPLSEIVRAGVTTTVGLLGTDNVTRHLESLLAKTKALNENITSFMYTGSYHLPSPSITESVKKDIALLNEVIGVKVAISDHRSSQPTLTELTRLASEARAGGILSGKSGLVHLHVGNGEGGLAPIFDVLDQSELPPNQFLPTHISLRKGLVDEGVKLIRRGGAIDITAKEESQEEIEKILKLLYEEKIEIDQVTLSSDGNGSIPKFDEEGNLSKVSRGKISTLWHTVKKCVQSGLLELDEAIKLISRNPAQRIGISNRKGIIASGHDADLVIVNSDLEIESVYGKGRPLMKRSKVLTKGFFE